MEFTYKDILDIIFNGVLASFTIVLAVFTFLLYKEAERTRIQNSTPQISIIFYLIRNAIFAMKIKNTNGIDAKNVNITCLNTNEHEDGPNTYIYSEKLSRKFDYLAANQEYSFMIGRYEVIQKEIFKFRISFTDMKEKVNITNYVNIDMNELDRIVVDSDPQKEIAACLQNFYNEHLLNRLIQDYTKKTGS